MKSELKSLNDITLAYSTVLLDTCALLYPLNGSLSRSNARTIKEKILISEQMRDSAIFFKEFLEEGGNFCVTPLIIGEYIKGSYYSYKNRIKKGRGPKGDLLEFHRKRKEESEEMRRLIRVLEDNRRIFQLDEDEQRIYRGLREKYSKTLRRNELRETNIDFLVSGVVVSKTRNPTCLISNNFRILRSWGDILNLEKIPYRQLRFFLRRDFDAFEMVYFRKKI
jgi:predicted nucleic acid-binding protein